MKAGQSTYNTTQSMTRRVLHVDKRKRRIWTTAIATRTFAMFRFPMSRAIPAGRRREEASEEEGKKTPWIRRADQMEMHWSVLGSPATQ